MCSGASNDNDNDKGKGLIGRENNPYAGGTSTSTPFSASTFSSFSPDTAAKFSGQSFNMGNNPDINALADQKFNEGQQINAMEDREKAAAMEAYGESGRYVHGNKGMMDPNFGNYTIGQQLSSMSNALAQTSIDFGVGLANAYRNTLGSIGTLGTNAAFGPTKTMFGRTVSHWSDRYFSDPDGFMGPNDAEAETYGSEVSSGIPKANPIPNTPTIDVQDIEPRFLGGAFKAAKAYLVGEDGPEVVVASRDGEGMVVPNPATIQGDQVVPIKRPTASDRFQGDFSFIQNLEGTENQGYVPKDQDGKVLGKSGVTIASGFDLGQRKNADLKGLPGDLIKKLQPYLGLKGQDALKLNAKDLNLSDDEVAIVNKFAKNDSLEKLSSSFMKETGESYYSIPKEAQTVVASVAFQYGDLKTRTPKFWKAVTNGKWNDAIKELENFGDKYDKRRNKEADLLRKVRPMEAKVDSLDEIAKKYRFL